MKPEAGWEVSSAIGRPQTPGEKHGAQGKQDLEQR